MLKISYAGCPGIGSYHSLLISVKVTANFLPILSCETHFKFKSELRRNQ